MITLPVNLENLYEQKRLGVVYRGESPLVMQDNTYHQTATVEPNRAYLVVYLSLSKGAGVMQINEEHSVVFSFNTDLLEFIDLQSDVIN